MQFSPGVFDKPYKQLLHYVPRFELMCRAPFPTPGVSPRFVEFDLEFGEDIYADCQGAKSPIKGSFRVCAVFICVPKLCFIPITNFSIFFTLIAPKFLSSSTLSLKRIICLEI